MTREEFDRWIEAHHTDLLKVARRRGGDADTVQSAILRVLQTGSYARVLGPSAWTWMVNAVRSVLGNARRADARSRAAHQDVQSLHRAGVSQGRKRPAPRAD